MIYLVVTVTTKDDKMQDWINAFKKVQPLVLKEDGCYVYRIHRPIDRPNAPADPNKVILLEQWESLDHLTAHLQQPHMKIYFAEVKDLTAGPSNVEVLGEEQ